MADEPAVEPEKPDPKTEIVRKVSPLLRPDKRAEGERIITNMVAKFHQGPLPPPEDLAHYEHVLPGSAERIMAMAETNMVHRHELEGIAFNTEAKLKLRGQHYALAGLVFMLAVIVVAIVLHQPWVAGALGSGTLISVVAMFLNRDKLDEPQQQPAKGKGVPAKRKK